MRAKIKSQKNPQGFQQSNKKLIPQKSHAEFPNLENFQKAFTTTTTTNFIENWKIANYITFPPANRLIEAGGAEDILQNKIYI